MSHKTVDAPPPPGTKRIKRLKIGLNVLTQVILLTCIVGIANYLGFRHYQRWDFSRTQSYTLSEKTRQVLKGLPGNIDVIVWFDPTSQIYQDIDGLLSEYRYVGREKFRIEYVDPGRNLSRARELYAKYKFKDNENVLIIDSGKSWKFLYEVDMVEYAPPNPFKPEPEVIAFSGEEKLTSTLVELSTEKPIKTYLTQGHGEPSLQGEPSVLSQIVDYISKENVAIEELNLLNTRAIPDDTDALFIFGAKTDLSSSEADLIKKYLENNGHLFILLDPDAKAPLLKELIADCGIEPQDVRVLKTVRIGPSLLGILKEVVVTFEQGTPITERLHDINVNSVLYGSTQALKFNSKRARKNGFVLNKLMVAEKDYWGETNHTASEEEGMFYDEGVDLAAPVILAAAAEKDRVEEDKVHINSSRIVVCGNALLVQDQALKGPNVDFVLNTLNWLVDRKQLIGIATKKRNQYQLALTPSHRRRLWISLILLIPAASAAIGLLVWWKRR